MRSSICVQGVVSERGPSYLVPVRSDAKGRADVQAGGWVAWAAPDFPGTAWVRFVDQADRLVPVDVVVSGDGGVTANLLRQVPLGRLEAFANGAGTAKRLRAQLNRPGAPDVRAGLRKPRQRGSDDPLHSEIKLLLELVAPGPVAGDAFYQNIADIYENLHAITKAPTTTIAEAVDVPVSTAKRWVREARKRGFLPPARQGKAG